MTGIEDVIEVLKRIQSATYEAGGPASSSEARSLDTVSEGQAPSKFHPAPDDSVFKAQLAWCIRHLTCIAEKSDDRDTSVTKSRPGSYRRDSFQQIQAVEEQVRSALDADENPPEVSSWVVSTYTEGMDAGCRASHLLTSRPRSKSVPSELQKDSDTDFDTAIVEDIQSVHQAMQHPPLASSMRFSAGTANTFAGRDNGLGKFMSEFCLDESASLSDVATPADAMPSGKKQLHKVLDGTESSSVHNNNRNSEDNWIDNFREGETSRRMSIKPGEHTAIAQPFAKRMTESEISESLHTDDSIGVHESTKLSITSLDADESCLPESEENRTKLKRLLTRLNKWNLDLFRLAELSAGFPLAVLGMWILTERDLINSLRLDRLKLMKFFCALENNYQHYPTVQYHNNIHGADVMHSTHVLLSDPALSGTFSDIEIFTAILAAAVHDVDHRGRTNAFLMKTRHPWATLYNDVSVLENHHASTAFEIMENYEGCDILSTFTSEEYLFIRKLMIDMVLSTDMARHTKFLGEFQAMIGAQDHDTTMTIAERLKENCTDRALVLCAVVHNADLGNCAKTWNLTEKWTYRLLDEFFGEGDEEKRLGLKIGPLNDRETVNIPKGQVGFINFIALPLWKAWAEFVSPGHETEQLRFLKSNLLRWKNMCDVPESEADLLPDNEDESLSEKTTAPI